MRSRFIALIVALLLTAACSGGSKPASPTPAGIVTAITAPTLGSPATVAPVTAAAVGTGASSASPHPSANAAGTPGGAGSPVAGRAGTTGATTPTVAAKEKPEDALTRQLGFEEKRQYGQEWDELHPAQQQFVPRDKFVQCTDALDLPPIQSVQVTGVQEVPLDLQSVPQKTAQEVGVTITVLDNGTPSKGEQTFDEVQVGDSWRWVLDDDSVDAYKAGRCPS